MRRGRRLTEGEQRDLLLRIARSSRGTLDLRETLDRLLDAVGEVVDYDAAGIFALAEVIAPEGTKPAARIASVARRGYLERPVADDRMLSGGEGLVGHAIRSGESVLVADVRRDPRYIVGRRETLSEVVVPILFDGRPIAALDVESDREAAYDASDLERLEFFALAAEMAIEKTLLHRHLLRREQLEAQMRLASEMQRGLMPEGPPVLSGWDAAALCRPSLELGGDLYDHFPLPGGRLGLVVGDVAGKGISAALVMATFRALVRSRRELAESLADAVAPISRLLRESVSTRSFVTCCYAALDPATGELAYASCGHPPGLIVRADGACVELDNCGPALGLFATESFVERRERLAPGDRLLLYTDGLTEAANPRGDPFGVERVRAAMAELAGLSARETAEAIARRALAFAESPELADDLTLVLLARDRRGP